MWRTLGPRHEVLRVIGVGRHAPSGNIQQVGVVLGGVGDTLAEPLLWLDDRQRGRRTTAAHHLQGDQHTGSPAADNYQLAGHVAPMLSRGLRPKVEITALFTDPLGDDTPTNHPAEHDATEAHGKD